MTRAATARRLTPVTFPGPAGALEGLLQQRGPGPHGIVAVICHPHPLYGGTLHNKVVHRTASTLVEMGAAVVRFNFRGVGKSEGHHDRGRGELGDARAALSFAGDRFPTARRWVAGFSFGAWIAARLAASQAGIERLILIAPPVATADFGVLEFNRVPKLVFQGTRDTVCPLPALEAIFPAWSEPKKLVQVEGATHFFDRHLGALAKALVQSLEEAASGGTSSST